MLGARSPRSIRATAAWLDPGQLGQLPARVSADAVRVRLPETEWQAAIWLADRGGRCDLCGSSQTADDGPLLDERYTCESYLCLTGHVRLDADVAVVLCGERAPDGAAAPATGGTVRRVEAGHAGPRRRLGWGAGQAACGGSRPRAGRRG